MNIRVDDLKVLMLTAFIQLVGSMFVFHVECSILLKFLVLVIAVLCLCVFTITHADFLLRGVYSDGRQNL